MRFFSLNRSITAVVGAGAVLLAGCGGGAVSPDKARGQVVAEAAGGTLPGATLEGWMVKVPVPPTNIVADGLISAWLNTALLIDAVRRNAPLDAPATVDSAIMQDAERGMISQFLAARFLKRPPVTDAQVDSLSSLDRVRVFQQIIFRIKSGIDTAELKRTYANAKALANKLQAGGDFTAAVKQYTEDTVSRGHNGYMPAVAESDVPNGLTGIWNMQPGTVSPPIAERGGFRIFRRVSRDEARTQLKQWLAPRLAQRADSIFIDSIASSRKIVVAADARIRLRQTAVEPVDMPTGGAFVTWTGGELSPATVREATLMLTPPERIALADASDTLATQFLMGLARRDILLPVVSTEHAPSADARNALTPKYKLSLDSLRAAVRRMPAGLSAADAATQYLDSMVVLTAPFLPLPGALASILRARSPVKVNVPVLNGVLRGAALKWQEVHKNDSLNAAGRGGAGAPKQ